MDGRWNQRRKKGKLRIRIKWETDLESLVPLHNSHEKSITELKTIDMPVQRSHSNMITNDGNEIKFI
jgi:hypothetical protein